MVIPTIVSLRVVEHDAKKMFSVPKGVVPDNSDGGNIQVVDGVLKTKVWVMHFGSYDDFGREVDTPCLLFRKGEYFDHGVLSYFGGQDSGYLTWGGFSHFKTNSPTDAHQIHASWFETGDIISFVRMSRDK